MTNPSSPRNTQDRSVVQVQVDPKVTDAGDPPSTQHDRVETGVLATSRLMASA